MRIFKTKYFSRFAKKESISNKILQLISLEIEKGLVEANLGSYLYKKRVPLSNKGKSGGYRTLLAYQQNTRIVFLYGFEKNQKDNITSTETMALKRLARLFVNMSQKEIDLAVDHGELLEVML